MLAQSAGFTTPTAVALNQISKFSQQHSDFRSRECGGEQSTLCSQPDLNSMTLDETFNLFESLFPHLQIGKYQDLNI